MIKSRSRNSDFFISEPNLIPLLDFMLVLVIMFVLLAGPIQQAIKFPIPEVKKGSSTIIDKQKTLISLENKNSIYIKNNHFTSMNEVEEYLKTESQTEITIAVNKNLEVETLMKLFAVSKSLGISTANIQIEHENQN